MGQLEQVGRLCVCPFMFFLGTESVLLMDLIWKALIWIVCGIPIECAWICDHSNPELLFNTIVSV